ncbi:MAG: hypothetical protein PHQ28_00110 [Mycobacterium sp.]|nr:hypothetical protein [Mycobacterium sp.]
MADQTAIPTTGDPIVLVGYVHSFPRHPQPGTLLEQLFTGHHVRPDEHSPETLYALVSVDWATEHTTIDLDSGQRSSEFRRDGFLGAPTGRSWYLTPALYDAAAGRYRLNNGGLARGHRDATLPATVVALGAPNTVPIHDFPL